MYCGEKKLLFCKLARTRGTPQTELTFRYFNVLVTRKIKPWIGIKVILGGESGWGKENQGQSKASVGFALCNSNYFKLIFFTNRSSRHFLFCLLPSAAE